MSENEEAEYLMLSGIQHFLFCRRQWALIHVGGFWEENEHTVRGEQQHEKVHDPDFTEKRKGIMTVRAMKVGSRTLGISGECDAVVFTADPEGVKLHGHKGTWKVLPVEYKSGKPKEGLEDVLQVVAQSMCLEEMLSCTIPQAALYYYRTHSRVYIDVTDDLREKVRSAMQEMHQYIERKRIPVVRYTAKCRQCSLHDLCMPKTTNKSAKDYIHKKLGKQYDNKA